MVVSTQTGLKRIREGFTPKVSQEKLARAADVTLATYRNAENGNTCKYSTAKAILDALNGELRARGQQPVTLDDLGLDLE